jgi:hypothetical protein
MGAPETIQSAHPNLRGRYIASLSQKPDRSSMHPRVNNDVQYVCIGVPSGSEKMAERVLQWLSAQAKRPQYAGTMHNSGGWKPERYEVRFRCDWAHDCLQAAEERTYGIMEAVLNRWSREVCAARRSGGRGWCWG